MLRIRRGRNAGWRAPDSELSVPGRRESWLFQLIDILHCGLSLCNLCEDFQHTFRADTAGRTLSAGLLHRKFQEEFGDVYHTVVFIEDNQAAGAHHRADGDQVVIVDGDIKMLCRDTAAGRPAGLCRLELLAARDPAADLLHDFTQSRSHRNLNESCIMYFASQSEYLCAF